MEFFIIDRNGQQAGPFSFDQLVQKGISPETLVWKQGMADWTPAWKVEELKAVLEAIEANQSNQNAQKQEGVQQGFQQGANQQQAQQQDYQKAQQEAYQQGFQQGAAMHSNFQQQPKKKTSHFAIKMVIGLIIFILAIFAVTNPSADAHKEKVRTEASKAVEKAVGSTDNNFFSQALRSVAKMMAGSMMDEAMNQLFEYHNYIVCSTGSVEFNGKHTVSLGILGNVYTMNADDMVKALESADNLHIEESESNVSSDNPNMDGSDSEANVNEDQAESDEGSFSTRMQKKLEEKANQAFDKAADKVSKKVEEKINQKLDETTDSSSIEKIIDKILELF